MLDAVNKVSVVVPVFRDATRALALLDRLARLRLYQTWLEVILVDDGSGDDTADRLAASLPYGARLVLLDQNRGRSCARNAGVAAARGEILLFIDSDCLPSSEAFVAAHLLQIEAGAIASTGPVVGTGPGFWHRYQTRSSVKRAKLHARSAGYVGSTANLMVRREAFERIGGFDEGYRSYGFEDRDLLIRLSEIGHVAWAKDAVVEHHDDLKLAKVCRKMREAGAGGAARFRGRHPEPYRALGYAAVDARLHPVRGRMASLCAPLLPGVIALVSRTLEWRWLPFALRGFAVRALSGASYLVGTVDALKRAGQVDA